MPHPRYCWILEYVSSDCDLGVAHPLFSTVMWERLVVAIMCVPDVLMF